MGTPNTVPHPEGMAEVLNHLRWLLVSLRMGGISHWPGKGTQAVPSTQAREGEPPSINDLEQPILSVREEMGDCRRCRLHVDRTRIVFGEGSPHASLVFVGEGPGYDEDQQGRPFVGKAGRILDKMISALGFRREEVYICNVVKCRPPNNRTPNNDEIEICSRFLFQQLDALKPTLICALGSCAAQTLLATTSSISRLRGKPHYWRGIPVLCTFHPAYLLRNPSQKAATWQDLIEIRAQMHAAERGFEQ